MLTKFKLFSSTWTSAQEKWLNYVYVVQLFIKSSSGTIITLSLEKCIALGKSSRDVNIR